MFERDSFFTVSAREVAEYAGRLRRVLKRIEDQSERITADDVLRAAQDGDAQIWAYARDGEVCAVAATTIHVGIRGKVCTIWVAAGFDALDVFEGAHEEIECWARDIGCYCIEIIGREGWLRVLPGYSKRAVVLEKSLEKVH